MKDTEVKLYVDKNVQPVTQPHRRIPFHLRKQVEDELQRLEKLDIIEKVYGPTDWVSPIVVAPKPKSKTNQIRICVDMRLPNQAIKRTRHIIPTIDDMIVDLSGAKVFSKLDLNQGYHQLELSEQSRNITTFTTHIGLRRYKRLSFGINSAAEIFQNALSTTLEGLDGVKNISDDIIVYARNQTEHDRRLEAVLKRLQQMNITLNKKKCEFNQNKLEFFGYVFGEDGMSADPKKVETIKNTPPPKNVPEVRSFLAMTNYVSRFIQNYSTIAEPLRRLIKKNAKWTWQNEQKEAFLKLKSILSSDTVMTYFDPNKETQIITDASPVGVAAIMLQEGKVVCYASRSLTDVERNSYSQQERENLALVWGVEHWHIYLYGHKFTVITDAKFIENIYSNPKSKIGSARLERWRMRLLSYDFNVIHKSGDSNMSDFLSRHPDTGKHKQTSVAEEYVNFLAYHDVPVAMNMNEIIQATSQDVDLQMAIKYVKSGNWNNPSKNKIIDTLSRCKNELSVVNLQNGEILLHESRIVIPRQLQDKVISLAHEGHQGIVKTKQLLREKMYFPGMDQLVEAKCKSCIPCLAATNKKTQKPLQMSEMPKYAFQVVSLDFCGPFPDGKYLLVLMDEYSRFPFVEVLNSITGNTVIPVLDKIFSEAGIPEVLKSDNGSPMNSHQFKDFAKHMGFKHKKITPLWPQANAECERFMKTIGKTIRASHVHHSDWKKDMYAFLRNYRSTPHGTTSETPSDLFYGRPINIKIPFLQRQKKSKKHKNARENDRKSKQKMKDYADTRRNTRKTEIKIGDSVLVKQDKHNKFSTPYDPIPYEVIKTKGSMVTAEREDKQITRNSSFFKRVGTSKNEPNNEKSNANHDTTVSSQFEKKTRHETPSHQGNDSGDAVLPRTQRQKKPPDYLKDYVCQSTK
ncbi:uncharacterized protein K02A2.6-like [Mercenaria mercenaria]|uniref:uncharacterized protein K02A2.6-like n=1 Tax=Mercenaria mercenaria TaxID=6596 RepID=UPI00234EF8F8|nr:uncharacterized protein K02A2.6-like [Mercenaria mercenaria]